MQPANPAFFSTIPPDTSAAARLVFPGVNFYLATGSQLQRLFSGFILTGSGELAYEPEQTLAVLYLITLFQYIEVLPDCRAAEALRERVDWKYALHLPLSYPGLDIAVLCKFRRSLLVDQASQNVMQMVLARLGEILWATRSLQICMKSADIVHTVCWINRLSILSHVMSEVIAALANHHPEWLSSIMLPGWYERYGEHTRLCHLPSRSCDLDQVAGTISSDGAYLLQAVSKAVNPELAQLAAIHRLDAVWRNQFKFVGEKWVWRKESCASCSMTGTSSPALQQDIPES
jgi:hypothetical protein